MRIKALVLIAVFVFCFSPVHAQKSKTTLQAEVTSSFPDQTTGAITPAIVRGVFSDFINSWQQYTAVNSQVGTTYTVQLSDYGQIITTNNAGAVAVTIPQPTGSFTTFNTYVYNIGTGTTTITPTGGATINGAASLAVTPGAQYWLVADQTGTNYRAIGLGTAGLANPTSIIGLTTINGVATTAMRSDAAPALSQSISPTMTGNWIFQPSSGIAVTLTNSATPVLDPITGTALQLLGADSSFNFISLDGWGTGINAIVGRRAGGTAASPSVTTDGALFILGGHGYDGNPDWEAFTSVAVTLAADGTHSPTSHPTRIMFQVTPAGSVTIAEAGRIFNSGGWRIGSSGSDPGTNNFTVDGTIASAGTTTGNGVFSTSAMGVQGTGGNGFLALTGQASNPSAAGSNAIRLFSNATGQLSWTKSDGFIRTFSDAISASRTYTLPDISDTLVALTATQTLTNKTLTAAVIDTLRPASDSTSAIQWKKANNSTVIGMWDTTDGFLNIGPNVTPDSSLTIMGNTAATVAPPATTYLHVVGADAANPRIVTDAFGGIPFNNFRRANGTLASKTAIVSTNQIGAFNWFGWNTSTYVSAATVSATATETWSGTANGIYMSLFTTPTGTATQTEAVRIQASGGVSVGTTSDPGIGSLQLNAQMFMPNITTSSAAQTGTVCWTTGTGKFTVDTTVGCLTSLAKAKHIDAELSPRYALNIVERLQPISFHYRKGWGDSGHYAQFGFTADQAATIDERLVGRDPDGNLQGFRYQEYGAVLTAAMQALKADNDNLRQRIVSLEKRKAAR